MKRSSSARSPSARMTPPVTGLKLEWDEAPAQDFFAQDEQRMMGAIKIPSGFLGYGFSAAPGDVDLSVSTRGLVVGHVVEAMTNDRACDASGTRR